MRRPARLDERMDGGGGLFLSRETASYDFKHRAGNPRNRRKGYIQHLPVVRCPDVASQCIYRLDCPVLGILRLPRCRRWCPWLPNVSVLIPLRIVSWISGLQADTSDGRPFLSRPSWSNGSPARCTVHTAQSYVAKVEKLRARNVHAPQFPQT